MDNSTMDDVDQKMEFLAMLGLVDIARIVEVFNRPDGRRKRSCRIRQSLELSQRQAAKPPKQQPPKLKANNKLLESVSVKAKAARHRAKTISAVKKKHCNRNRGVEAAESSSGNDKLEKTLHGVAKKTDLDINSKFQLAMQRVKARLFQSKTENQPPVKESVPETPLVAVAEKMTASEKREVEPTSKQSAAQQEFPLAEVEGSKQRPRTGASEKLSAAVDARQRQNCADQKLEVRPLSACRISNAIPPRQSVLTNKTAETVSKMQCAYNQRPNDPPSKPLSSARSNIGSAMSKTYANPRQSVLMKTITSPQCSSFVRPRSSPNGAVTVAATGKAVESVLGPTCSQSSQCTAGKPRSSKSSRWDSPPALSSTQRNRRESGSGSSGDSGISTSFDSVTSPALASASTSHAFGTTASSKTTTHKIPSLFDVSLPSCSAVYGSSSSVLPAAYATASRTAHHWNCPMDDDGAFPPPPPPPPLFSPANVHQPRLNSPQVFSPAFAPFSSPSVSSSLWSPSMIPLPPGPQPLPVQYPPAVMPFAGWTAMDASMPVNQMMDPSFVPMFATYGALVPTPQPLVVPAAFQEDADATPPYRMSADNAPAPVPAPSIVQVSSCVEERLPDESPAERRMTLTERLRVCFGIEDQPPSAEPISNCSNAQTDHPEDAIHETGSLPGQRLPTVFPTFTHNGTSTSSSNEPGQANSRSGDCSLSPSTTDNGSCASSSKMKSSKSETTSPKSRNKKDKRLLTDRVGHDVVRRTEELIRLILKPYFHKNKITIEDSKNILRKAVPKICQSTRYPQQDKVEKIVKSYLGKCIGEKSQAERIAT